MFHVYVVENLANGMIYVGQSENPRKRMNEHMARYGSPMSKDASALGRSAFRMSVVAEYVERSDAMQCESLLILLLGTCDERLGYNKLCGVPGPAGRPLPPLPFCLAKLRRDIVDFGF